MPDLKTALSEALARSQEQEALKHTLNEWEDDEQRIRTNPQTPPQQENTMTKPNAPVNGRKIVNNVMRTTFNYVRDNKNSTRKSTVNALLKKGFKESSVNAVLSQLLSTQQVHKHFDGTLHTVNAEYEPISPSKIRAARINAELQKKIAAHKEASAHRVVKKILRVRPKNGAGIAALEVGGADKAVVQTPEWTPEAAVGKLNVMQARRLYDYLKNVFGG